MKQENKEIKKNEEMINELDVEKLSQVSGGISFQVRAVSMNPEPEGSQRPDKEFFFDP